MPFKFTFTSVQGHTGSSATIREAGVTCVVGANNAGKSQLLRDLVGAATSGDSATMVVLTSVARTFPTGSPDEAKTLLDRQGVKLEPSPYQSTYQLLPSQNHVELDHFHSYLEAARTSGGLAHIREAFVRHISAGSLSGYAEGELRTEWNPERNNWLLRSVYSDEGLERELSDLMQRHFNMPVFMDRHTFPPRMRVGTPPQNRADAPVTREHAGLIAALPTLDEQGDGLRSFFGLALVVLALTPSVLLLDEPESFLHPGQARAVGRWLAGEAAEHKIQVVVATHDKDFLVGLLSAGSTSKVDVVRVARTSAGSRLRTISSAKLDSYWGDPVLRYSNALQGLFHERVVICEGDADCRFYSAAMDELASERGHQNIADDTLFVSSNGKNGITKMVGVLADLGVKASVIVDFDILNNKKTLQSIVDGLGESWSDDLDAAYESATTHIPKDATTFWKAVKNGGLTNVSRGQATVSFKNLIEALAKSGIHVVRVGELEDFYTDAGKGPGWVGAALTGGAHRSEPVCDLVERVLPELRQRGAQQPTALADS